MNDHRGVSGAGVGVIVLNGDRILLGKRHNDPKKASSTLHGEGTWTIPGGKIDFGEQFEEAARRELLEETSLHGKTFEVISITNDVVSDAYFITIGLLCTAFDGEPRVMEPDEITEWQWFSFERLPTPLFFPAEKIIKNYKDHTFYKH